MVYQVVGLIYMCRLRAVGHHDSRLPPRKRTQLSPPQLIFDKKVKVNAAAPANLMMVNHGAVTGNPLFQVTLVDHVVVAAGVVARLQLVPAINGRVMFLAVRTVVSEAAFTAVGPSAAFLFRVALETLLPAEITSVFKHVPRLRVQSPEGSFARLVRCAWHFDEAVVEREGVTYGILPALLILAIKWEQVHDELVDFTEGEHLGWGVLDRHRDE